MVVTAALRLIELWNTICSHQTLIKENRVSDSIWLASVSKPLQYMVNAGKRGEQQGIALEKEDKARRCPSQSLPSVLETLFMEVALRLHWPNDMMPIQPLPRPSYVVHLGDGLHRVVVVGRLEYFTVSPFRKWLSMRIAFIYLFHLLSRSRLSWHYVQSRMADCIFFSDATAHHLPHIGNALYGCTPHELVYPIAIG